MAEPKFVGDIPDAERLLVIPDGEHHGPPGTVCVITGTRKYYLLPDPSVESAESADCHPPRTKHIRGPRLVR